MFGQSRTRFPEGNMKVKLTRISSNHRNLRTDEIIGTADRPPTVGQRFFMTAPPLATPGGIRWLETTPVQVCERIGAEFDFHTRNSHYRLLILEE
jgi:hypothetical protein